MNQASGSTGKHAPATVSADRFLYKLGGSSQPCIIQGSDNRFYVVKFHGHAGERGLLNEVVGSELIRQMGLPSPGWTRIEVSADFIDRHPGLWFVTENASSKPRPGFISHRV